MNMNNLLIPLHKLARRQDENFLTEILVFLLNYYVQNEPESAIWLIKLITDEELDLSENDLHVLSVEAQHHTPIGIPDIKIETPNFICFIEVKVDADFDSNQLSTYKGYLQKKYKKKSMLITLTKNTCEEHKADIVPDFGFRWRQLSDWLDNFMPNVKSGGREFPSFKKEVSVFIAQQYIQLLKSKGIIMEKINWQLVEGLREFRNILDMIREVIGTSRASIGSMSVGQERAGYYGENKKFFVGIYMNQPEEMVFITQEVAFCDNEPEQKATDIGIGISEYASSGKWRYWKNTIVLTSEDVHFFSRSKTSQFDYLVDFINKSLDFADKIIKP
jgi:hypothetical protein